MMIKVKNHFKVLGWSLFQLKRYDEVIKMHDKVIELYPHISEFYNIKG